jgi:hypothetical protein
MFVGGSFRCAPETEKFLDLIIRINAELERAVFPLLMTEKTVERFWTQALQLKSDGPSYWLLLVRLAEAALLCAGNYADNGEFQAAGDLLLNPREMLVHRRDEGSSIVKNRHGRLSEQFGLGGAGRRHLMKQFSAGIWLETTKSPLLPHMTQVLRESARISRTYLQRLEKCQRRIADALAFLAAWCIFDSAELWRRLETVSARERAFAESCLCRFDARIFRRIGADLKRSLAEPGYRSPFLAGQHTRENEVKRVSPVTVPAIAGSPE